MANYENGEYTRKAIVDACTKLFYEKGYYETSYADICETAHVNRSTIYYHFENKEAIRYEVLWAYTIMDKHLAEQYCDQPEYHYILAMCIMWNQLKQDEHLRKFNVEICRDYPVFTGRLDISHYYTTLYKRMWEPFWEKKRISELSYASVYGYIMSYMRLACMQPDSFDSMEMFRHCVYSSTTLWGIPKEKMDEIWNTVNRYLLNIPQEQLIYLPVDIEHG